MPLKKGNTNIESVYLGTTPIGAIYKGTTIIYESFKWLPYSFTYLYHSLIPNVISGKTNKDLARVSKIYANGEIENQLVQNGNFESTSGWTNETGVSHTISNNEITITNTIANNGVIQDNNIINGHKYFFIIVAKSNDLLPIVFGGSYASGARLSMTLTANYAEYKGIYTANANSNRISIFSTSTGTFNAKQARCIDLTQQFGAGNEPTSVDDNRIKRIIAKGYIPYNTGTYKGTNIEAFESEPFNLLTYTPEKFTGYVSFNVSRATKLRANTEYMFRTNNTAETSANLRNSFAVFDLNGNRIISKDNFYYNGTLNSNAIYYQSGSGVFLAGSAQTVYRMTLQFPYDCYVMWGWQNADLVIDKPRVAIYNEDLFDYYAPHISPATLLFKYQGNGALNVHDTMEITKTEYVFTKNALNKDMGSFAFEAYTVSGYSAFRATFSGYKKPTSASVIVPNVLTNSGYTNTPSDSYASINNSMAFGMATDYIYIRDDSCSTASDLITKLSGKTLIIELATPQVIRIPRKHLGIVDLGSLNYIWGSSGNIHYFYAPVSGMKGGVLNALPNVISSIYTTKTTLSTAETTLSVDKTVSVGTSGNILIRNDTYTDATAFKQAMAGTYLFYETADEVADIDTEIVAQGGGTITSDSEVLPNVDFEFKCK